MTAWGWVVVAGCWVVVCVAIPAVMGARTRAIRRAERARLSRRMAGRQDYLTCEAILRATAEADARRLGGDL